VSGPTVRRDTALLLTARLFMSASQAVSSVALPLSLIHAGMGPRGIGAVLAAMLLVGAVQMVLVGGYADRGFLRVFLVGFPSTSVLCAVPFLLGAGGLWLAIAAVAGGYGGGVGASSGGTGPYQPAEYAWIGRNYPDRERNGLVGRFSAVAVAGVVLGSLFTLQAPLVARVLHQGSGRGAEARGLMFVVALLAVVPTVIGLAVREPTHVKAPDRGGLPRVSRLTSWRALVMPVDSGPALVRLTVVGGLNGVAIGCYGQFVTVWLILHFGASASAIGLLNLVIAASCVLADLSCARIARALGLVRSVLITRVVQALLIIVIALSPSLLFAEVFLLLRQLAQRLNLPLRDSYSIALAAPTEKARLSALTSLSNQATMAASSEASGVVIERIGYVLPFCASALFQLASAIAFYLYFAKVPPPEERDAVEGAVPPVAGEPAPIVA
jgi:MFS family permease